MTVDQAVRRWGREESARHEGLVRLGYFGSYARDDWGVGSDLDLVAVVRSSKQPFERRAIRWNLNDLPVTAELLVYTEQEWHALQQRGGRFAKTLAEETIWIDIEDDSHS